MLDVAAAGGAAAAHVPLEKLDRVCLDPSPRHPRTSDAPTGAPYAGSSGGGRRWGVGGIVGHARYMQRGGGQDSGPCPVQGMHMRRRQPREPGGGSGYGHGLGYCLQRLPPRRVRCRTPDGRGEKTTYPVAGAGSNAPRACGSPFICTSSVAAQRPSVLPPYWDPTRVLRRPHG